MCTWAVPYFIGVTGFYAFSGREISFNVKNQIIKLIRLYFLWTLIYLPIILTRKIYSSNNILNSVLLGLKNTLFFGSYWQLWYIVAVIWGLIIYLKVFELNFYKPLVFGIAILPYFIFYLQTYFDVCYIKILNSSNVFTMALPFLMVGVLAGRCRFTKKTKILGFVMSFFLWVLEGIALYHVFGNISQPLLFLLPLIYFFLSIVCNTDLRDNEPLKMVGKRFRSWSTLIYFSHTFNITLLNKLLERFGKNNTGELMGSTFLFFLCVLLISLTESEILIRLSKKYKLLRYLYA